MKLKINFDSEHDSLTQILLDKGLAKIGDAFVNLVFSLAVSIKRAEPASLRVSSRVMSDALKESGYRRYLPSRIDRHQQGDAVEALMAYSWLEELVSLEECVSILQRKVETPVKAFTDLITTVMERLDKRIE